MINILLFILMCFGLTQILTAGKIFDSIRPKHYYFKCAMCIGFPVGMVIFCSFWLCGICIFPNIIVGSILFGFISSGTSYVLCRLFDDNGINIKIS